MITCPIYHYQLCLTSLASTASSQHVYELRMQSYFSSRKDLFDPHLHFPKQLQLVGHNISLRVEIDLNSAHRV
jgi:hypothetical protein